MLRSLDGETVSLANFKTLEVLNARKVSQAASSMVFSHGPKFIYPYQNYIHLAKIKGQKVVKHPCHKMRSHEKVALIGATFGGPKRALLRSASSGDLKGSKRWKKAHIQRHGDVGVSLNGGFSPQIIHLKRVFHYKPSILGYPYFWKHPHGDLAEQRSTSAVQF